MVEGLADKAYGILLAVLGVLGTNAGANWLKSYVERKKRTRARAAVYRANIESQQAYRQVHELRKGTAIGRVLIFRGHNNGSAGEPLASYHVRCVQAIDRDIERESYYLNTYRHFVPDQHYKAMLAYLVSPNTPDYIDYQVDMLPQSKLRLLYEGEGVRFARVFLVDVLPDHTTIYGSCAVYGDEPAQWTAKEVAVTTAIADNLKRYA